MHRIPWCLFGDVMNLNPIIAQALQPWMPDTTREPTPTWPFPPATGPVPWTAKQEREYRLNKISNTQDAPQ
jgi:hypothetical protein